VHPAHADREPARQRPHPPARSAPRDQAGLALGLQRRVGNAQLQRIARTDGRTLARSVAAPAAGLPPIEGQDEYRKLLDEYRALLAAGEIGTEDKRDADVAIASATGSIRAAEEVYGAGSTAAKVAGGSVALAGALVADDLTGFGIADDVAIPFVLVAAAGAGLLAWGLSSSAADKARALDAARVAVSDAIAALGTILMAAKAGDKIRSLTDQTAIHLARILGTDVGGMPPDHQNDPERDRPHWWKEVKNFVKQIKDQGLSPKQLGRELSKRFTKEQFEAIMKALKDAAKKMGEDPPDFPPVAFP
jgi:hypothetical protein